VTNQGRYLGRGIASYIEDTGLAPFEGATIRVEPNGKVVIQTGAASQGQGHATGYGCECQHRAMRGDNALVHLGHLDH